MCLCDPGQPCAVLVSVRAEIPQPGGEGHDMASGVGMLVVVTRGGGHSGLTRLPVGGAGAPVPGWDPLPGVRTPGRSSRWRDEGRGLAGLGCQLACLHTQDPQMPGSRKRCAGDTG